MHAAGGSYVCRRAHADVCYICVLILTTRCMQLEVAHSVVERMVQRGPAPTIRIGTSAYVSIRICQHTSAYVSIRQHISARSGSYYTHRYVRIRQHTHTSAYARIRQRTSAYVSIRQRGPAPTIRIGTQFTCVTSRKIHILTQLLLYAYSERATRRVCATEHLALLAEKYTY